MANRKSKFELSNSSVFTKEKLIWCRDKIENGRGPMQSALKTVHSQTTVIVYEIHQWYKYFEFTLYSCSSRLFRNSTSASPIHRQWHGKCKALGKCFSIASVVILSSRLLFFLHRIMVVTAKCNLSANGFCKCFPTEVEVFFFLNSASRVGVLRLTYFHLFVAPAWRELDPFPERALPSWLLL